MRLIDADELKKWLKSPVGFRANCEDCTSIDCLDCIIEEAIDNAPTIEAAPVVYGKWEDKPTGRYGQQQSWCSACRKPSGIGGIEKNRHRAYCPNCGARMDGTEVL